MNFVVRFLVFLAAVMVLVSCKGKSSSGPYDDDLYPDDNLFSEASSSSLAFTSSSSSSESSSSSQGEQSSSSSERLYSSSYVRSSSSKVVSVQDFDTTFTDPRDGKIYRTVVVNGDLWFGQNLNYASGGYCYQDYEPNCEKYGRLYTFSSAQEACPSGWRLPNRNEAQAVINDESFPWSYSGRCKTGECDFTEKMGFHWTSATPQDGDKNYGEKTGEIAVIIVEKEPSYAGEETPKFFQVDEKPKYFSVRCVQE